MSNRRNALLERFFTAVISGNRQQARTVVNDAIDAECDSQTIMMNLYWPTAQQMQTLHRNDQLSALSYHYGTRLLRSLVDQMQLRLETGEPTGERVLVACGEEELEELAGQMASDLLEAAGHEVYFAGGGVANDEIVAQLGEIQADRMVIFGAVSSTVPQTRLLIDRLHELGACPQLQIVVGGGVFNRADGLAEEIGADLWANDPAEVVQVIDEEPQRRMSPTQRTVGRTHRPNTKREAA